MRARAEIVERARLHVGHRESPPGSNDSVLIRAWLRRCGVTSPAAWCAAFASWCVEERAESPTFDQGRPVVVTCAGALKLGRLFPETREPQPGDLMWFATDNAGHGHVGIVAGIAPDGVEVLCIEGNSANSVRHVRRLRAEVRFSSTRPAERWIGDAIGDRVQWVRAPLVRVQGLEGTR